MPIRLGRWEIDIYQRAIHITREPDPDCPDCAGHRCHGWTAPGGDADWDECRCLDDVRTWRLPFWARRPYPEEAPF